MLLTRKIPSLGAASAPSALVASLALLPFLPGDHSIAEVGWRVCASRPFDIHSSKAV